MSDSLRKKTGLVSDFAGYAIRSTTPETAFSQKAHQMIGKKPWNGARGMPGTNPRIRRSIAALMPARNASPTV